MRGLIMTDMEVRNQRVRDYLAGVYGTEGYKRSFLLDEEAEALVETVPAGRQAFCDLNTFAFKHYLRCAVEDEIRSGRSPLTYDFWRRARSGFLNRGGRYRDGLAPSHWEK